MDLFLPVAACVVSAVVMASGCSQAEPFPAAGASDQGVSLSHPFLLFNRAEVPALAQRKQADKLLGECWEKLQARAAAPEAGRGWARQLEARGLLWQLTGDGKMGDSGIELMRSALE
ncbi:hypothetical protein LCGC14_2926110, partial [marine sediment metagenome]